MYLNTRRVAAAEEFQIRKLFERWFLRPLNQVQFAKKIRKRKIEFRERCDRQLKTEAVQRV